MITIINKKGEIVMQDTGPGTEGITFQDYAIVACGTMNGELKSLKDSGFLDASKILFTKPGRHEVPRELEEQLVLQIKNARKYSEKIIVVYGGKFCYLNASEPSRTIDMIIEEQGDTIKRINATHCIDMLASSEERDEISDGKKVLWLTPGWIKYRQLVYQDWDKGKANENFPQHTGGAILLDGIGFWDEYCASHTEEVLDFSDWMGIPINVHNITLHRFQKLLSDCVSGQGE
jgi:hypothetical protein